MPIPQTSLAIPLAQATLLTPHARINLPPRDTTWAALTERLNSASNNTIPAPVLNQLSRSNTSNAINAIPAPSAATAPTPPLPTAASPKPATAPGVAAPPAAVAAILQQSPPGLPRREGAAPQPGGKRGRGALLEPAESPTPRKLQLSEAREAATRMVSIPVTIAPPPSPPPKSSVPGVMAPGPAPSTSGCGAGGGGLPVCEAPWPVLPYLDAVEHLLKSPDAQPLTFHRRVTRPLTHFIAAVATALHLQDTSKLGAGMLFLRALIRDDVYGRLAVYDTMQGHAERADWSGFFQCVCEYLESAGFDISKLFVGRNGNSASV